MFFYTKVSDKMAYANSAETAAPGILIFFFKH